MGVRGPVTTFRPAVAAVADAVAASAPVGDPANLVGTPRNNRMAWPDAAAVSGSRSAP
jgi:hypothetical protein